ncbi:hypothetical protein K457DRAFT_131876 [Linnemannia elongata AG-77]|uniref:Uncharacterized protein n=1 Tax=Linnemannia elongata AG-77 TaxID=1314771 RepID=A0A197KG29_9FUNG|nr:hypothetical protein K457DRAFT_131876 [Linnemannia elongata AG-77]
MDFTFTVPSGIPPITFGSTTSTTTSDATSPKQPTSSTTTTSAIDSLDEHISLKRIHGVGDTKQWRRRLIHQIEDRIKDRREAIHNAQRRGFVGATGSSGSGNESGVGSRAASGGVGDEFSRAALPGNQGGEAVGPSEALVLGGDSYISEEEERRIVAEVWEAFKNENYEALALAFQGMTDKELEDIEQEILQHNYATESDPMYEAVMDMEETNVEEYVQQYMNQTNKQKAAASEEMMKALSVAWTLLSSTACIRCHQGGIIFDPLLPGSLAEGARALCNGSPGNGTGEGRGGCGFRLERDALLYLANAANTHSQTCAGQLQVGYDEDIGLLVACSHCDFLA